MNTSGWMGYLWLMSWAAMAAGAPGEKTHATVIVLVRGDDMGVAQAANAACVQSYREGIVRSVEVVAPGAWFLDAARLLQEQPGLDVGVHLTLTSEWERCKWRPLTHAPSLVDRNGYFQPATAQRKEFPPGTGFLEGQPKLEEVEAELRVQIEMVRRHVPRVSHLSVHMGTAMATPTLRALTQKLAREYGLPVEVPGLQSLRGFRGTTAAEREASLVGALEQAGAGRWLLVEHPGLDTPEMRGLGHLGYYHVAADRAAVTAAFTSEKVRQVIRQRGIRLASYGELLREP